MLTRRTMTPRFLYEQDDPQGGEPPTPNPASEQPAGEETPGTQHSDQDRAFAELRRAKEKAERDAQAARDALAERERKEAEEQGRWKELAEQEKARADQLAASMAAAEQQRSVEQQARALRFRDPDIVQHLLPASVDRNDTDAVRAALEQVATERPHLIDNGTPPPPPPSGGPAGGKQPAPPTLTREQLAAMPAEKVAALPMEEIAKALQTG